MENKERFDLEQAIARWRTTLEGSPSFRASDLEELESHLRDSIQALQTKGLDLEEAFRSALKRMGDNRQLSREFDKANRRLVWLDHILWMALGLILFGWIQMISSTVSYTMMEYARGWKIGFHWSSFIFTVVKFSIVIGAWLSLWHLATRYSQTFVRWIRFCIRHPLLPVLGMLVVAMNQATVARWILRLSNLGTPFTIEEQGVFRSWQTGCGMLNDMLYLLAFGCLVWRHYRIAGEEWQNTSRNPMPIDNTVQVWMDRSMWMMAAVAVDLHLVLPMQNMVHAATMLATNWLPYNGYVCGFFGMGLHGIVFLTLAGFAWRVATKGCARFAHVEHFLARNPKAGAVHLVCAALGLNLFAYFLRIIPMDIRGAELIALAPKAIEASTVLGGFMFYADRLVFQIVPVLLVCWLVHRRFTRSDQVSSCDDDKITA